MQQWFQVMDPMLGEVREFDREATGPDGALASFLALHADANVPAVRFLLSAWPASIC